LKESRRRQSVDAKNPGHRQKKMVSRELKGGRQKKISSTLTKRGERHGGGMLLIKAQGGSPPFEGEGKRKNERRLWEGVKKERKNKLIFIKRGRKTRKKSHRGKKSMVTRVE